MKLAVILERVNPVIGSAIEILRSRGAKVDLIQPSLMTYEVAEIRIQRVFPQPLDPRAERQDVGRFPRGEAARELVVVEIQRQAVRQAPVGRHHRDARRMAFGEAREKLRLREHFPSLAV